MSEDLFDRLGALNPCAPQSVVNYLPADARVLDLGCGEGRMLQYLWSNGWTSTGAEPDPIRALAAKQNCPRAEVVCAKAEALPFPRAAFDAVIMECVFSLCEPRETVAELSRVLVDGGIVIITDLYARRDNLTLKNSAMVRNLYTKNTLESYFENGFILFDYQDKSRELTEMFAQMLLDETLCGCVDLDDLTALRQAKTGYGVWSWFKRDGNQ